MITSSIERVMTKLYDGFCDLRYHKFFDADTLRNNNMALHFVVTTSCDNFGYETDGNTLHEEWAKSAKMYSHFLLHYSHRVYHAGTTDYRGDLQSLIADGKFVNVSNHDSCYREAVRKELNKAYFFVYDQCWSHMPDAHKRAPIMANISVEIGSIFEPTLFQFVALERKALDIEFESRLGDFDAIASATVLKPKMYCERTEFESVFDVWQFMNNGGRVMNVQSVLLSKRVVTIKDGILKDSYPPYSDWFKSEAVINDAKDWIKFS